MNKSVLIIDDSLTVRMDLSEAFKAAGFHPAECSSVQEARRFLSGQPPALIILDVILPDADGIDFLAEIRSDPVTENIPIFMLSSEAEVHDRIRGLKSGADEYIGKPYDTAYIIARANELVSRRPESSSQPTILIIDDSTTFREALKSALESERYTVLTAATGEEGLKIAAHMRPHAVIVDGIMPGIDGPTVIRRIRLDAALRGMICLLLTASGEKDIESAVLDAGADAFLRKEEDMPIILARLAAALRASGSPIQNQGASSLLGPKKILAVDDSPTYLQAVAAALRGESYEVILVQSGEEAIELLTVQLVDCILLDLMMPGLSGQDACRRIKATRTLRDIPIIMLTALEEKEAMLEGLSVGADDYIAKSNDFEVLKARVRTQIRRRQFEDENRRIRSQLLETELEAANARAARELAVARADLIEQLEQKNRELEAFSYSVSHDLRAPLRAIEGFSNVLMQDYCKQLPEKPQHYLQRIHENARHMGCLIDDLLAFSRLGRQPLNKRSVNPISVVKSVLEDMKQEQEDRKIEITIGEMPPCQADYSLLRLVILNLLSNAFKYTQKTTSAKIQIGSTEEKDRTVYWIKDNGVGFDMKFAGKLFRVFQRLHRPEDFEGTGVGLALSQRIIQRHGGNIWATAAPDQGATFYFTIPGEIT